MRDALEGAAVRGRGYGGVSLPCDDVLGGIAGCFVVFHAVKGVLESLQNFAKRTDMF